MLYVPQIAAEQKYTQLWNAELQVVSERRLEVWIYASQSFQTLNRLRLVSVKPHKDLDY